MKSCKTILCIYLISVSVSLLLAQCETISFEKANYADWTLSENQDSLSPTVKITRKDNQSLFNIAQESGYSRSNGSPVGTLWAHSSTQNSNSADYGTFVTMHGGGGGGGPQSLIDQTVSLYLPEYGFYFDIVFSSYSGSNSGGGFAYTRTCIQSELSKYNNILPDKCSIHNVCSCSHYFGRESYKVSKRKFS